MSKILVVDDSSTVRDEVAGFLRKNGLDVDTGKFQPSCRLNVASMRLF